MLDLNDIFPVDASIDLKFMQDVLQAIGCALDPSLEIIHLVADSFLTTIFSGIASKKQIVTHFVAKDAKAILCTSQPRLEPNPDEDQTAESLLNLWLSKETTQVTSKVRISNNNMIADSLLKVDHVKIKATFTL